MNVAARMWLQPDQLGTIVDRGSDWREDIQGQLDSYGPCWVFRDDASRLTTRVRNLKPGSSIKHHLTDDVQARATYKGETRGFEYLTPKVRVAVSLRLDAIAFGY